MQLIPATGQHGPVREVPPESPNSLHGQFCPAPTLVPCAVSSCGLRLQWTPLLCPCTCPDAHTCSDIHPSTHLYARFRPALMPHTCPGAHPSLPTPAPPYSHTCPDLTCPVNFIPGQVHHTSPARRVHSCPGTCTLLARVPLCLPGHVHSLPAQMRPHLPVSSHTCPGAFTPAQAPPTCPGAPGRPPPAAASPSSSRRRGSPAG